ncbi:TSC22 domain family protein 1 isoform X1 [Diabrotica virgifera virgifera]|nr:TSC22 domain family protein 1 isoform X1 [Diabrotica virgifera virgifera]
MTEVVEKHGEQILEPNLQVSSVLEEFQPPVGDATSTNNTTNVIPTSTQYGVAIIPNASTVNDLATETVTPSTETLTDTTSKAPDDKELHSTPSRNDRFKVVKIASLEPFKRGRWKCMDYVDEAPPVGAARVPQSSGNIQVSAGTFMQTQSLPQQQFQQMLLQTGFTNGTQFFANVPPQMIPQGQYFYPQVANVQNPAMQQVPNSIPAQFITNQPYFPAGVVQNAQAFTIPQGYSNVQYVPANLIQNQNSAFVPTSSQPVQLPPNFQQSQSYAGQPNVSQTNVQTLMNGHTFTPQNEQVSGSLSTQTVKSVIMNSNNTQPAVSQTQVLQQNQNVQNVPVQSNQNVIVAQGQAYQQQSAFPQNTATQQQSVTPVVVPVQVQPVISTSQVAPVQSQTFDQSLASNVYTNPQFAVSVSSLTVLDNSNSEKATELTETQSGGNANVSENVDDPSKTNPVVNAIDNKIEQAMDLVKSHLMYTVREEVEVLKEKIAELMERIQQLETENNFLRSQIPKSQNVPSTPASTVQQSTVVINPNSNFSNTAPIVASETPTVTNTSHNPIPNTQSHSISTSETLNPQ